MEPILTKEEIADLLAAVREGRISPDSIDQESGYTPVPKPTRDLDLLQIYVRDDKDELRIPNLDILLDVFAKNFSIALTNQLQRTFTINRLEITSSTFQDSLLELEDQGAIGIYSIDPLKYGCLFHFDTMLSFTLLEIMLGSSNTLESIALNRQLTTIEINVLKSIMASIGTDLRKSFRQVVAIDPKLIKVENNFRLVNIVDSETEVLVSRFQLKVGQQTGEMRLIIPYLTLEPIREKIKEIVTVTHSVSTWANVFQDEVKEMSSLVIAQSGKLNMAIRQILELEEGDIIDLGYDPDSPLTILVEDKPKFFAIPGERNGKKAFHITGIHTNRLGEFHGNN
ncbi:flagellar motor switch protein FliM [Desulfolithobacter sp.]